MRILLAGTSHWHAQMHLDAARHAGADDIRAWDLDAAHGREFAERFGLVAEGDFDVAIADADLVVLMGHPDTVPGLARRVIEAGTPMILEKPAAPSTKILAPLAELARSRGAFVGVPLPNRFGPAVAEYARLRQAGSSGKLAHASFRLVNGPPQRYRDDAVGWLLDPSIGGGGALRNLGIHGIDAALSLADGPLTIVSSSIGKLIHAAERVEDHALVVLTDAAGTLFTVEAGYTYASMAPGGDFEWRLVSANSTLVDRGDSAFCATLDDGERRVLTPEHTSTRYRLFTADTLRRLSEGRDPAISLDDYLAAMQLIDSAYEKAGL